jgi:(p)ppGpp synthase/HD superfamily hydrolase
MPLDPEQIEDARVDMGDLNIIQRARAFAIKAHGNQQYGHEPYTYPYTFHLEKVRSVLLWMGVDDPEIHAAALLHDVIEDTATNYNDLVHGFGTRVADIVYAVTDELGRNRAERHAKTYPKTAASPEAILLKQADRIANVEFGMKHAPSRMVDMYRKEHEGFSKALGMGGSRGAWLYLDALLAETPGNLREGA